MSQNTATNEFGKTSAGTASTEVELVKWVTCPHCWHRFRPDEVLWVAQHEDLMGDSVIKDEPMRFLPTHFTLEGQAIDARGMVCHTMACSQCHLSVPRMLLENEVTFMSLIGSVGSGKSNFLAAMTWQLRQVLPRQFSVVFGDVDKESNWILNRYEESLFLPDNPDRPVVLEKTRTQGDLYRSVRIGGQEIQVPKPFLFSMHPTPTHPRAEQRRTVGTVVCLYDNAGEHYGVGQDTALSPVTRHLAKARVLMFLFDPTQDTRFREKCKTISHDPQVVTALHTVRQETILSEAAQRVRRHLGLSPYERHQTPLIVLVGKSDIWGQMLRDDIVAEPIYIDPTGKFNRAAVDMHRIERTSQRLRLLLLEVAPEIVTAAEDFCAEVLYIPVSALGRSPEPQVEGGTGLFVRPRDIHPHWVTVPLLYSCARWRSGLIAGARPAKAAAASH